MPRLLLVLGMGEPGMRFKHCRFLCLDIEEVLSNARGDAVVAKYFDTKHRVIFGLCSGMVGVTWLFSSGVHCLPRSAPS